MSMLAVHCATCAEDTIPVNDACPWCGTRITPVRRRGGGRPVDKHLQRITPEQLARARELYQQGYSLRQVAKIMHPHTGYKNVTSCTEGLYSAFRTRGWKLRPQGAVTAARNRAARTTPGTAPAGTAEYKRARRSIHSPGLCAALKVDGTPCTRYARFGTNLCISHDPTQSELHQTVLAKAWDAYAATCCRWGDVNEPLVVWFTSYGHGAGARLARASGVSHDVISRTFRKQPDALITHSLLDRLMGGLARIQCGVDGVELFDAGA